MPAIGLFACVRSFACVRGKSTIALLSVVNPEGISGVQILVLWILVGLFVVRPIRRKNEMRRQKDMEILTRNALTFYGYKKLLKATNKFSKKNLLGNGGFGSPCL
ncbi:hypothetical protein LguiA_008112 [Lonicera macranthoides]